MSGPRGRVDQQQERNGSRVPGARRCTSGRVGSRGDRGVAIETPNASAAALATVSAVGHRALTRGGGGGSRRRAVGGRHSRRRRRRGRASRRRTQTTGYGSTTRTTAARGGASRRQHQTRLTAMLLRVAERRAVAPRLLRRWRPSPHRRCRRGPGEVFCRSGGGGGDDAGVSLRRADVWLGDAFAHRQRRGDPHDQRLVHALATLVHTARSAVHPPPVPPRSTHAVDAAGLGPSVERFLSPAFLRRS